MKSPSEGCQAFDQTLSFYENVSNRSFESVKVSVGHKLLPY